MNAANSNKVIGLFDSDANQKRIADMESKGVGLWRVPHTIIDAVRDSSAIENAAKSVTEFDWIIFSDIYCVDVFIQTLVECNVDLFDLDNVSICAFGEAVADRLRFEQIHSDVILAKLDAESILTTLRDFVDEPERFRELRVLFLGAAEDGLTVSEIRGEVASLIELKTHSVSTTSAGDKGRLLALLKGGVVDQMMFCSVDDVHSIRVLVSPELLISLFAHIEVKAIDDVTSQALHEIGLNPTMIRK